VTLKKIFPVWVLPVLVAFATGTVWLRLSIVATSYEINQIGKMNRNAIREVEKLELKVAQLRSPSRLERLAKKKYKLAPPKAHQVIPMDVKR